MIIFLPSVPMSFNVSIPCLSNEDQIQFFHHVRLNFKYNLVVWLLESWRKSIFCCHNLKFLRHTIYTYLYLNLSARLKFLTRRAAVNFDLIIIASLIYLCTNKIILYVYLYMFRKCVNERKTATSEWEKRTFFRASKILYIIEKMENVFVSSFLS